MYARWKSFSFDLHYHVIVVALSCDSSDSIMMALCCFRSIKK